MVTTETEASNQASTGEQPTEELTGKGEAAEPASDGGAPARRRPMPFEARLLSQALFMLCVGVLGLVAYLIVVSPVQENGDQDRLYATFREQLAEETAPTGGEISPGSPVALLTIPTLHVNDVVVEGTASGDLEAGPGHVRDTPLPGQAGWSLLYGKAATFGAPFGQIDRLRPGDRIDVTTGQGAFTYRVARVRHPGDPLPPALATNAGRLTMETAAGSNPLMLGNTVYVDADLLDTPAQAPSGRPTIIPPEEGPMASDQNGNVVLVLWLQALGVLLGGVVWARRAWGRREALLIGVPLVVAVLWNIYESVARLLPNML